MPDLARQGDDFFQAPSDDEHVAYWVRETDTGRGRGPDETGDGGRSGPTRQQSWEGQEGRKGRHREDK